LLPLLRFFSQLSPSRTASRSDGSTQTHHRSTAPGLPPLQALPRHGPVETPRPFPLPFPPLIAAHSPLPHTGNPPRLVRLRRAPVPRSLSWRRDQEEGPRRHRALDPQRREDARELRADDRQERRRTSRGVGVASGMGREGRKGRARGMKKRRWREKSVWRSAGCIWTGAGDCLRDGAVGYVDSRLLLCVMNRFLTFSPTIPARVPRLHPSRRFDASTYGQSRRTGRYRVPLERVAYRLSRA
jgi:hypothetical protein